jgi:hypothetical protein
MSTLRAPRSLVSETPSSRARNHCFAARELHRHLERPTVAVHAHEDVLVRDERPLRIDGERGAADNLLVRELDDDERDRIDVVVCDGAVIDGDRVGETALPGRGHLQPVAQPGQGGRVSARARRRELAREPGGFALRLLQRVADALKLRLESGLEVVRLARMACAGPLDPRKARGGEHEKREQSFRGAAQGVRLALHLRGDPHRRA